MKRFIPVFLGAFALASLTTVEGRVGPVSQYGQLVAGKNSSGKGQIYGSCPTWSTSGNEVVVQGLSFFWNIDAQHSAKYWNASTVERVVRDEKVELVRAAVGIDENWGNGNWMTDRNKYQGMIDAVVQGAIDQDIYVIIDFHSHKAHEYTSTAKEFFEINAQKWGSYDNVIFEIYNEPLQMDWGTIKNYANEIVQVIRKYSDNLILVGNPAWDQEPHRAIGNQVTGTNIAYTFHFYAGGYQHTVGGIGANAERAMNAGLSVFVSEWGNSEPDGNGSVDAGASSTWYNWMVKHKLSGANWSITDLDESSAYYAGGQWTRSQSGRWTYENIFSKNPTSYTACNGSAGPASSSSVASSSSALPAGYTNVIDDVEDANKYGNTGGVWYAYNDAENSGRSTITNKQEGEDYIVSLAAPSGNNTQGVAGITGISLNQGGNEYEPFVALGYALNENQSVYDLSKCTAISYKYQGAAHNFKVELSTVTDYDFHLTAVEASNSWKSVRFPTSYLLQAGWGTAVTLDMSKVTKFTWEVKGEAKAGTQTPTPNYLYIDDVVCEGASFKPVEAPVSSSSSKPVESSSSVEPESSSSAPVSSSSEVVQSPVITGALVQTIEKGKEISPISITGIQNFTRNTWNIYFLNIPQNATNGSVAISGTIPANLRNGDFTETFTINGETVELKITVIDPIPESSSSENIVVSSSSEEPESSSSEVVPESSSSVEIPAESSSSVEELPEVSSSSVEPESSSSAPESSSSIEIPSFVIAGELHQIVEKGKEISPITITGIQSFSRNTWNINFVQLPQNALGSVTFEGLVQNWAQNGDFTETFTINGETVELKITVIDPIPESSSSENIVVSSSSEEPASSSSEVIPESSSSEITDYTIANAKAQFKWSFGNKRLTLMLPYAGMYKVEVFDMMGHVITRERGQGFGAQTIDLNALSQGTYLVKMQVGSQAQTTRIQLR